MSTTVVHAELMLAAIAMIARAAATGMVEADSMVAAVPWTIEDSVASIKSMFHVIPVTVQVQQHLKNVHKTDDDDEPEHTGEVIHIL